MLELADELIDQVTQSACKLAKHRGSSILEIRDLAIPLGGRTGFCSPLLHPLLGTCPSDIMIATK